MKRSFRNDIQRNSHGTCVLERNVTHRKFFRLEGSDACGDVDSGKQEHHGNGKPMVSAGYSHAF